MSVNMARKKRTALYLSIAGLMLMVAAISTISARDPDGVTLRIGMILVTVGASMWLPWQALVPAVLVAWLGPNVGRGMMEDDFALFNTNMMWELPGLLGLAAFSSFARVALRELEEEHLLLGLNGDAAMGLDPQTGVYDESQLRISIEAELSRSRRFGRTFALVLVGIDEMRQRFDYRDEASWQESFSATAELLRGTRHNVDRVYRYGPAGFALVLPESGPNDVNGLVRRLRRVARKARPAEGEPGGPLPAYFGATFFPTCATSTEDLLRRAEVALRIADKNANRVQLDGAEAPEMPPVETLRQPEPILKPVTVVEPEVAAATSGSAAANAAPSSLFAEKDGAVEVDEEPPFEVYALQAPEPAVDEYAPSWQSEAPLSVLPKPHPRPLLVAIAGGSEKKDAIDDSVNDALKRLDETLDLIRSLKQRSA
ncbi:MAG TPA: diguanylate cyclase [Dehalococcoidia bacterium]